MQREFASLTPQEGLHVAIFIEQRNAELYRQFSELFREFKDSESLEIASAFVDMAEEERNHGRQLQERYFERFGASPCGVTEDEIRDFIEVPRLDDADLFAIVRSRATPAPRVKALEVAIEAERSALRFYGKLADITSDSKLRSFYLELAEFESDHVEFLERKIEREKRTGRSDIA
ncbi:MAG: ferritin family protein [Terriglobales bacterium]